MKKDAVHREHSSKLVEANTEVINEMLSTMKIINENQNRELSMMTILNETGNANATGEGD